MNARHQPTLFVPLTGSMRARLEATIEHLTALLDEIDGDADFEPDSDDEPDNDAEPSLGWTGDHDDRELDDEDFEDDDPAEDDGTAEEDDHDLPVQGCQGV